jgi:hypothetical protein
MDTLNESQGKSLIKNSGNSDVDLNIQIDIETKSIAYAMLCSQYAKGDLSEFEFEKAIEKLNEVIERDKEKQDRQEHLEHERLARKASVNRPNIFQFPMSEQRRNWM